MVGRFPYLGTALALMLCLSAGKTHAHPDGIEGPVRLAPLQLAQFQLPLPSPGGTPAVQLPSVLTYQYAYGSESKMEGRRNRDLDRRLRDSSLIATPQINGYVIYRPTRWLETTLEMIAEKEIPIEEQDRVTLPSGETQVAAKRRASLLVDQAFFTVREVIAPFEFSAGRKNYEDERHWLYDTSMDIASLAMRQGRFRAEVFAGREVLADLDLAPNKREPRDRTDTLIVYLDYRMEDVRLGAYTVNRHDRTRQEGHPRLFGVRAHGTPSDRLNYWGELAYVRGKDDASKKFDGRGFDIGFTYRFPGVAWNPNVTAGYASATGDASPDDNRNSEFRQSGLHSNEQRFAGVAKFKYYGEALDPELSNLKILTAGLGFRPAPTVSIDFVLHRYEFDELADEVRNSALTALANQAGQSKDVGKALDVIVGLRSLFGVRRLGIDLRLGWFFPGRAFVRNEGDEENPNLRRPEKAIAFVAKIWW